MPRPRFALRRVARTIGAQQPTSRLTLVVGTVASIAVGAGTDGGDVVTVTVGGDSIPAPHGASYSPTVGDDVWVLLNNGSPAILGRFIGLPNF